MSVRIGRLAAMLRLVGLSAITLGCSGGAGPSFDTPEACFEGAKEAIANKDPLTFCRCLTEESQQTAADAMVRMGGMMKMMGGLAPQFAQINAVLEKYGVNEDALKQAAEAAKQGPGSAAMQSASAMVHDKPMFIAEMIGAMDKLGGGGPTFAEKFAEEYMGELKDVKIDGDKATATLAGPSHERTLDFRKSANGWKLHVTASELQGAGAAAPAGPIGPAFPQ